MQKKPTYQSAPQHTPLNGRATPAVLGGTGTPRVPLLGRAVLLRHPLYGRARTIAALIVGTYAVDERYVVVQAFPIGKPSSQLADVQLVDEDPGETNEAVAWLVK